MEIADKELQNRSNDYGNIRSVWNNIKRYRMIYLFMLPGILFLVIFNYIPMYGITLAFKEFSISKGIIGSPWVGFDKFRLIWENEDFWRAFVNTLQIAFLKILFGFPFPIILALLINEIRSTRFKRIIQTLYTFPHFLSWVVISGIMMSLLSNDGAINNLLAVLGVERVGFLTNNTIFRILIIFTDSWKESGWSCIMYLAAIASIDLSLYESVTVDGGNRWHKMRYITWPGMKNMAAILLILAIGNVMNAGFDQIFNMYNPSVFASSDIIDTYIYRQSFQMGDDLGYSTAVGLFKGVINFVLLISANKVTQKLGNATIL